MFCPDCYFVFACSMQTYTFFLLFFFHLAFLSMCIIFLFEVYRGTFSLCVLSIYIHTHKTSVWCDTVHVFIMLRCRSTRSENVLEYFLSFIRIFHIFATNIFHMFLSNEISFVSFETIPINTENISSAFFIKLALNKQKA